MNSTTLANPSQGNRFWILDLIRGLAVFTIVCFHIFADARNPQADSSTVWISWLRYGGALGISTFFVLSGFSIHLSQAQKQATQENYQHVNSALKPIPLNDAIHFILVLVGVLFITLPLPWLFHKFLELHFSQNPTRYSYK